MIDFTSALTIVGMGVITYSTRLIGYFALRNRRFGPRAVRVMDAAPGCVIAAVIAPHFVSGKPDELIAMLLTAAAACRCCPPSASPCLPTPFCTGCCRQPENPAWRVKC